MGEAKKEGEGEAGRDAGGGRGGEEGRVQHSATHATQCNTRTRQRLQTRDSSRIFRMLITSNSDTSQKTCNLFCQPFFSSTKEPYYRPTPFSSNAPYDAITVQRSPCTHRNSAFSIWTLISALERSAIECTCNTMYSPLNVLHLDCDFIAGVCVFACRTEIQFTRN